MEHEVDDYADEYGDMVDIDDDPERTEQAPAQESDSEGDGSVVREISDTSSVQARQGMDIQGIPWSRLQFTRQKYREKRLSEYRHHQNLPTIREELDKNCKVVERSGKFYDFQYNTRKVRSHILHFQLRNLVWTTTKHDVYVKDANSIVHWSAIRRKVTKVLDTESPAANKSGLGRVQISTMCVKRNLLVAGGFLGEMVCKNLNNPEVSYCNKITYDDNGITNAIEIFDSTSGATCIMSSNNDAIVRVFDTENFCVLNRFHYSWAVNHTSVSPNSKMVVVVGDEPEGLLADCHNGKVIATVRGHLDFSFASAWHPDGHMFATGNQDTTCRLWDIRQLDSAVTVLKGRMGAIRSIRFTSDGSYMAMAEPADFVHIFDTRGGYNLCQEIDIFGEVAGISFSPDTEALYVGVADRTYASLLEFSRIRDNTFLFSHMW